MDPATRIELFKKYISLFPPKKKTTFEEELEKIAKLEKLVRVLFPDINN